jgi:excisionase family DNA binding protein
MGELVMRPRTKNHLGETPAADLPSPTAHALVSRGSLLRVHEAAAQLNCSISTLRRLIREKKLPAYRVGRGIRIAEADLERLLEPLR